MYLETERLILRAPKPADISDYLPICNSAFVLRYNAMSPKTEEQLQRQFSQPQQGNTLVLELKASGQVIGAVFLDEDSLRYGVASRELSYFLREDVTHKGYMKEALHAVVADLFAQGMECVAARVFAPNTDSRMLLEVLGFRHCGTVPRCVKGYGDIIYDDTLYTVFPEDFH